MTDIEQIDSPSANTRSKGPKKSAKSIDVLTPETPIIPRELPQPADAPARVTKLDQLVELLETPHGATIEAMCAATGWQAHSVRGALAGTLKRKGLVVTSTKPEDGPRRYRIGETA